ncbi:vWA domain-containing protein [Rubellicoccus peritrichatus]|uniref:VWA domain-containing protein n=1 Tax=Rubellicoccus peritrichatus TaxID=3080537 RepID=A0AAQ3QSD3_9BACT|nr:VWA domain-containing protein [Puniceicoccus sp. CR14]WOO42293.1 VWA domain-containing protein [Puniceicoccus sp. CR14]
MVEFGQILWLLAIPVALTVIGLLFYTNSRSRKELVRKFASDRLVRNLLESYSAARNKLKRGLIVFGIIALVIALARPIIGYDWKETKTKGIDILFALDASRSMLAQDIKPNRLDRAKFAILDFIEELEGDRVGLVAFAGEAFLQCPLTLDYNAFRQSLEAVDTEIIATGGTDIARAINESESAFQDDNNYKIIVMITDGEDLEESGIKRAEEAAENGVTIYSVGVGTPEGAIIPIRNRRGQLGNLRDSDGKAVLTKLDETTLSAIAEVTNGFYVPLGPTGYGLEQVYEAGLESIPEQELAAQLEQSGIERFQWPLGLAILLLAWEPLIGTRRRFLRRRMSNAMNLSVLFGAMGLALMTQDVEAQEVPATNTELEPVESEEPVTGATEEPVEEDESERLIRLEDARLNYNHGNTLYKDGDYVAAAIAYEKALETPDLELQADAFYNLGNSYYREGQAMVADSESTPADVAMELNQLLDQVFTLKTEGEQLINAEPKVRYEAGVKLDSVIEGVEGMDGKINVADWTKAIPLWQKAVDSYQSAAELFPMTDAEHNLEFVKNKVAPQQLALKEIDRFKEESKGMIESLKELSEKLKRPSEFVLAQEARADALIQQADFGQAFEILNKTSEEDPTSWVFKDKLDRLKQVFQKLSELRNQ